MSLARLKLLPDADQVLHFPKGSGDDPGSAKPERIDAMEYVARVSRQLKLLHAHALIAKIPHSRRWRVTRKGHAFMAAAVRLATHEFPRNMAA